MDNLLPPESIGIIDSTLACLVSWLEGHSLAQTVFTNLYLHRPQQVQDKVMKAFAVSVYKIIDIFKDFIGKALVFEEEDFQTMSYGYKLKPEVSESKAIAMLKDVEEDLQRKIRNKTFNVTQGIVSTYLELLLGNVCIHPRHSGLNEPWILSYIMRILFQLKSD